MTGRRAVRQWDERLSRALQFVPGHVGGRVASAQPIRRRGGTLRRVSVGAAGGASVVLPTSDDDVRVHRKSSVGFSGSDYHTWGLVAPDAGDMLLSAFVGSYFTASSAPTYDPPAGWTTLLSGSTDEGDVRTVWKVAAVDSYTDQGRTWALAGSPDDWPFETTNLTSWRVTGASGMTWQTPTVAANALTATVVGSDWAYSGTVSWVAPNSSWLIRMQLLTATLCYFDPSPDAPASQIGTEDGTGWVPRDYNTGEDIVDGAPLASGSESVAGSIPTWQAEGHTPGPVGLAFTFGAK